MAVLFDYQINYYSDSKNETIIPFTVFALTQQGLEHQHLNIGNQDSGSLYVGRKYIIGAVADGCTGGVNINKKSVNQVGAFISSYLAIRICRKLLVKRRMKLDEYFLTVFEQEFLLNYKRLLNSLNPWQIEKELVIRNFLLSTLTFFVVTDDDYLVAHCGDGDVIINNIPKSLNGQGGNYFALNLWDTKRNESGNYSINPKYCFHLIEKNKTTALKNIFISTDGFLDAEITETPLFNKFFFNEFTQNNSNCFKDRRTEFRRDFLTPLLQLKRNEIWPHDDATFISLTRYNKI
jgi:hypothetical protein